jgi:hypothetical protein
MALHQKVDRLHAMLLDREASMREADDELLEQREPA